MDRSLPGSSAHGDSPGKNTGVGCHARLHGLLNSGIKPRSATLQVDSLLSETPGKPKNIGLNSQSLPQEIFPTQEIEPGSPALQVDSLPAELPGKLISVCMHNNHFCYTQDTKKYTLNSEDLIEKRNIKYNL